jgi:hypothetical protein
VPPPEEVIDHAAEVALPPKLAPDKVSADAFLQRISGPPGLTVGFAVTLIVLVAVAAAHAPEAFVVSVNVTVPLKLAAGVNVTVSGEAVCVVLLKVPLPEVIDHAPVEAPPPITAPLNVIADGVTDSQTVFGPPALTVGNCETVMFFVEVTAGQDPEVFVVNNKVTFPA